MVAALEVGTQAVATQVTPEAATLEIPAAVVRAAVTTPVEVTLAAATQGTPEVEIPAARVVARITRRAVSENASRLEAVESLTIGPFEKADRK